MAIRKPSVSVEQARRMAKNRPADTSVLKAVAPQGERPSPLASDPSAAPIEPAGAIGDGPAAEPRSKPAAGSPSRSTAVLVHSLSGPVFPEVKSAEPKIQVFLTAPLPARGVSASFDVLGQHYPPTRALQMILRRALDNYEIRLENGSYKNAPVGYPVAGPDRPAIIQTSRMLPVRLVETAQAHFDPLGFESGRAFGRKLACAALASFFEAEGRTKK